MKRKYIGFGLLLLMAFSMTSCKKYLNINTDPDTTQEPDPSSVMPAMLAGIPRGNQYDARFLGLYTQNWIMRSATSTSTYVAYYNWEKHGYQSGSDNGGDIWRQTYYGLGANLNYMIDKGIVLEKWDYVGAAYALKAYQFMQSADQNGPIIFHEAFKPNTLYFNYEDMDVTYKGIDSLLRLASQYLSRTDGKVSTASLAKGDYVYDGDRTKWLKFSYGLMARLYGHLTSKADFNTKYADSCIKYVDLAFASGADDFLIPFDATKNDDTNFFGTYRNNLLYFGQSNFIVKLLDGTTFVGNSNYSSRDPRLPQMLTASQDTTNGNGGFRGLDVTAGGDPNFSTTNTALQKKRIAAFWGDSIYTNPSASAFSTNYGHYLFRDKCVMPVMTYSELQFLKAEAALRKGGLAGVAYTAYLNGIRAHFDFINRSSYPRSNTALYSNGTISTAKINAYMASPAVKQTAGTLTLTDIMLQKYIALWGWGFLETWTDLRRYHYTDLDPATGQQVFLNFQLPTIYYAGNGGNNPAYRMRPRYNSEYVWNQAALDIYGGLAEDYHTKQTWLSMP